MKFCDLSLILWEQVSNVLYATLLKFSISLVCLNQSSLFFHHCKGKSMTYLEMDNIFSRFLLFLKYSPHPIIAFFFFYSPGIVCTNAWLLHGCSHDIIGRYRYSINLLQPYALSNSVLKYNLSLICNIYVPHTSYMQFLLNKMCHHMKFAHQGVTTGCMLPKDYSVLLPLIQTSLS